MQSRVVLLGSRDELLYTVATGLAQYKLFIFTFNVTRTRLCSIAYRKCLTAGSAVQFIC